MAVARHGTGPVDAVRAYASQIHPVFMLPPVAASVFGAILAGPVDPVGGSLHAVAIFAAVYTAHVKDGYVDFHWRDEDDDHPLSVTGCVLGLVGATVLFVLATIGLWLTAPILAVALTIPTWPIAYFHAPQLDVTPIGATMGYPVGIGLSILGGYAVQAGLLGSTVVAFAIVFVVLLAGIKVIDDTTDVGYDRGIRKRTVAVVLGPDRSMALGYGLIVLALVIVTGFVAVGALPIGSLLAAIALGCVVAISPRSSPKVATMVLIRGTYVFLAVLVAVVWFEPFSGVI